MTLPIVMAKSGRVNTEPLTLRTNLVNGVAAVNPGYTADLPGSLIEDIVSTDVAAMVVMDQAVTELVGSITPFGANEYILAQQGYIMGVVQGEVTNTSVFVVFTDASGTGGFVIDKGFTVGDGTYQYVAQDTYVIGDGGTSGPVYCLATQAGTWSVPADTVTEIITSVPSTITITVTNPEPGTPSSGAETIDQYRARVLQAYGRSASTGMVTTLKTLLSNVSGVQLRLIAVQQESPGWKIIVGGGDPYDVAAAIFKAIFDVSTLVGSADTDRNITVSLYDYPDTYAIIFVNPPAQSVAIDLVWNTISPNTISAAAVASLGNAALVNYVNTIAVGQPINLFQLESVFKTAVASIVPPELLTRMVFEVSIDGTLTPPEAGTGIIAGDPEGYFETNTTQITIVRG